VQDSVGAYFLARRGPYGIRSQGLFVGKQETITRDSSPLLVESKLLRTVAVVYREATDTLSVKTRTRCNLGGF
jgi:hypothetical protein